LIKKESLRYNSQSVVRPSTEHKYKTKT